jgi:hypothetical protein
MVSKLARGEGGRIEAKTHVTALQAGTCLDSSAIWHYWTHLATVPYGVTEKTAKTGDGSAVWRHRTSDTWRHREL